VTPTPPRRPAGSRLLTRLGLAALALGAALLVTAVVLAGSSSPDPGVAAPAAPEVIPRDAVAIHTPSPSPESRKKQPKPRPKRAARPLRIEIPAIGVRARVIGLGLNPDRSLEVPTDFAETGWWTGGSRPGEPGPAIIAGHVDSTTGPAVFYRLGELRAGDAIAVVGRDGSRARFTVQGSEQYPKTRFPTARVYGRTTGPTLRLITCSGTFDQASGHYLDNTVVYARAA